MVAIKETKQKSLERRHVDFTNIPGSPRIFTVYNLSGNNPAMVGRALVIAQDDEALIWSIEVVKKYRNQGYGSNLLFAMQNIYNHIVTSWYSDAGKHLCLKCGFKIDNSGKVPKLIWTKEEKDAGKEKDHSSYKE